MVLDFEPLDLGAGNLVFAEQIKRELQTKEECKKATTARKVGVFENPFEGFYYGKGRHHPKNNKSYEVSSAVSPGPMYFPDWRPGMSKWTARSDFAFAQTSPATGSTGPAFSESQPPSEKDLLRQSRLRPRVRQEVLRQLGLQDASDGRLTGWESKMPAMGEENLKAHILKKSTGRLSSSKTAMARSASEPYCFRPKNPFRRCWLETAWANRMAPPPSVR